MIKLVSSRLLVVRTYHLFLTVIDKFINQTLLSLAKFGCDASDQGLGTKTIKKANGNS